MLIILPGPIWIALAAWLALFVWLRLRRLRELALIQALALLIGRDLPLVRGLRTLAEAETGGMRKVLERLAHQLAIGDSISGALRQAHWGFSGETMGAIIAAEQAGTLATTLRELAQPSGFRDRDSQTEGFPARSYFTFVSLLSIVIFLLLTVFLAPKFRDIFLDFGSQTLPPETERLLNVSDWVVSNSMVVLLSLLGFFALWAYAFVRRNFAPPQPDHPPAVFPVLDAIRWWTPIVGRIERTTALARQTPILQASLRAGHDIAAAARHAAEAPANYYARRALRRWAARIEAGEAPLDAARAVGIAPTLRQALASPAEGIPAALSYLARYYDRLRVHWRRLLTSVSLPFLVLILGALIGYAVIAFYLPSYRLIESLANETY